MIVTVYRLFGDSDLAFVWTGSPLAALFTPPEPQYLFSISGHPCIEDDLLLTRSQFEVAL